MVFTVGAVPLNDGSQRVLQQFEADVGQVPGNVAEVEVLRTDQLDRGAFEHPEKLGSCQKSWHNEEEEGKLPVMFFAYVSRILNRFLDDVVDVLINQRQVD